MQLSQSAPTAAIHTASNLRPTLCSICLLPKELLHIVAEYVSLQDLLSYAAVCTYWRVSTDSLPQWGIMQKNFHSSLAIFSRWQVVLIQKNVPLSRAEYVDYLQKVLRGVHTWWRQEKKKLLSRVEVVGGEVVLKSF